MIHCVYVCVFAHSEPDITTAVEAVKHQRTANKTNENCKAHPPIPPPLNNIKTITSYKQIR